MSDSVKLRFEHGIWCLIFSYVALITGIVSIFLVEIIDTCFIFIFLFALFCFILLVGFTISNFQDAIKLSKKEENIESTNIWVKRCFNKTLD